MSEQNTGNAVVASLKARMIENHIACCKRCKRNAVLESLGYKGTYCQLRGMIDPK